MSRQDSTTTCREPGAAPGPIPAPAPQTPVMNGRAGVCILYGIGRQDEAADLAARLTAAGVSWILPQADRDAADDALVLRYLATDPESPAAPALHNRLATYKQTCLLAVRGARCLMLLEPGGADGWYLAGIAQAAGKPVCRYADLVGPAPAPMLFDTARAYTLERAVDWVRRMLAATPLVSVGQGAGERHYTPYAR